MKCLQFFSSNRKTTSPCQWLPPELNLFQRATIRSRFLRRFRSDLTRPLLYLNNELGATSNVSRTGFRCAENVRQNADSAALARHRKKVSQCPVMGLTFKVEKSLAFFSVNFLSRFRRIWTYPTGKSLIISWHFMHAGWEWLSNRFSFRNWRLYKCHQTKIFESCFLSQCSVQTGNLHDLNMEWELTLFFQIYYRRYYRERK